MVVGYGTDNATVEELDAFFEHFRFNEASFDQTNRRATTKFFHLEASFDQANRRVNYEVLPFGGKLRPN
jgi:hypothetical protein